MRYPFSAFYEKNDNVAYWVAKSASLKGCIGQGDTLEEALKELQENENAWLETAEEAGIAIPEVPYESLEDYSGKMTIRISSRVHMYAAQRAKQEGISLNQYINNAIVAQNAMAQIC